MFIDFLIFQNCYKTKTCQNDKDCSSNIVPNMICHTIVIPHVCGMKNECPSTDSQNFYFNAQSGKCQESKKIQWHVSSTFNNDAKTYGMQFIDDGHISFNSTQVFKTLNHPHAFAQAGLGENLMVTQIRIIQEMGDQKLTKLMENIEIRIGHFDFRRGPNNYGRNQYLTTITPAPNLQKDLVIDCRGVTGKYITIRKMEKDSNGYHGFSLNEVYIDTEKDENMVPGINLFYNGMKWWSSSIFQDSNIRYGIHNLYDNTQSETCWKL